MDIAAAAAVEVQQLHSFFARWYATPDDLSIDRVMDVLDSDFELLAPTGEIMSRGQLLNELLVDRGAFPDLSISIEQLYVRLGAGGEAVARYVEVHQENERTERRVCCALLRRRGIGHNGLHWVAIGERYDA
jgi:hypothetical protein